MTQSKLDECALKRVMKEALEETLRDQREFLQEVFAEVLENFVLAEAIHEGRKSKRAIREEIFGILQGPA